MQSKIRSRGFTLVELLVVVSIIALLIAILLPSLKKARDQAKDASCRSNLHQLGIAIQYYMQDNADRLPWIQGKKVTDDQYSAPFRQYHQIFHFLPYIKNLDIYVCPHAGSSGRGQAGARNSWTVREYKQGEGAGRISHFNALKADQWFKKLYLQRAFPFVTLEDLMDPQRDYIEDVYTEFWFNDWSLGAADIPSISGNIITNIPYPDSAVMMADALHEVSRHHGGKHLMFVDAHVEWRAQDDCYDRNPPSYQEAKDKDQFGNRPYWAWGLSDGRPAVDGAQNY
ncbi:MAG: prepilin-type N-terminal cleavage/methylation domain-containing protein [bacterium]|nr:prepilin-type N-terminal cleavage/methylation domain-containing protein [bacterium]